MKRSASIEGKLAAKGVKIAKRFLQWLVCQSAAPIATTAYRKLFFQSKRQMFQLQVFVVIFQEQALRRVSHHKNQWTRMNLNNLSADECRNSGDYWIVWN
jgi:hypothetical protein